MLSDETFAKELLQKEDAGAVQKALEEKGIELTLDESRQIGVYLQKVRDGEISQEQIQAMADGELSEDELMDVAGGGIKVALYYVLSQGVIVV